MKLDLYSYLTAYGSIYETTHFISDSEQFVDWSEKEFTYVQYNLRKDIRRYGLSITSLDGGVSGIPDLDSLYEYNKENNTRYSERAFRSFTPVFNFKSLKNILEPIKKYLFRSHVLKLDPGGFFPPHRDFRGMNIDSFRLIIPLKNLNPPGFNFILEDKLVHWSYGTVYFVDTAKMHYLFNASFNPSYMIVLNVDLNEETIKFVTENLREK